MDGRENMIGRRIQSLFIKLLITVVDPRSGVFERPASCWQSSLAGAAEAARAADVADVAARALWAAK